MKHGKKYVESAKLFDKISLYDPAEALELSIKTATAKFDETIEAHIRLGVDSRHADQQVRGAVVLPNGTGKTVRVAVFAKGDDANQPPKLNVNVHLPGGEGEIKVGNPVLEGAKVEGKVLAQVKGEKIRVYKYKSKKNYHRTQGHRQPYTKVEITAINA